MNGWNLTISIGVTHNVIHYLVLTVISRKYYTSRCYPNINMNKNNSNRLIEYKKKYYFWAIQDKYKKMYTKKKISQKYTNIFDTTGNMYFVIIIAICDCLQNCK